MDNLLEYKHVSFNNLVAVDKGSGAKDDMSGWRPDLPDGWFYLGQAASPDWTTSPKGVIVRALQPDVLKDVIDWELVWCNAGSGKTTAYALWRGVPPNDEYVVVGGIFTTNPGWAPPTQDQRSGIKAVRKDALTVIDGSSKTGTVSKIWLDKGSGATRFGSVWTVVPHPDYPSEVCYPFSMIPVGDDGDYKQPSTGCCYILSATKTVCATNALLAYQFVTATTLLASDRGARETCDMAIWRPELPEGWFYFGGTVTFDDTTPPRDVIFMALQPDIVKDVMSWKLAWSDAASGKPFVQSTWFGYSPADGYAVVTSIFSVLTTPSSSPPEDQTKGIKAIKQDVLTMLMVQGVFDSGKVGSGYVFRPDAA